MSDPGNNPERWAAVERLYQAALEREPDQRESFLREACANDESLLQEVLSLLHFDEPAARFLQGSPLQAAARLPDLGSALIGRRVGPYTVLSFLGAGGMGQVYRALDPRLGRDVAIKVLPENLGQDSEMLKRFKREARIVASLSHPNILSIHDFGTDQGLTFAVMELLEGETLAEALNRAPLSWRRTAEIGISIAEGLAAAHGKGVTHRDLKPANVFITADNRVKILDFGIARVKPGSESVTSGTATQPGAIVGTVAYMSPEQVRGEDVETSSDIFTFGSVLYEMLAGRSPFQRETSAETMTAILKEEPRDLALIVQDIPAPLVNVVHECLRKDRADRLQSASELARRLKALVTVLVADLPARPDLRRARRFTAAAVVSGVTLLVLIAVLGYWFGQGVSPPPQVRSIAVLPFKPLAGASDEALEFGMADTLIMRLSRIRQIVVRPLSAVRRYSSTDQDSLRAGKEQKVDAVLEGSMQRAGDRIRITARLLRVEDGSSLWAEQFDENFTDIFSVQDRISTRVADALALKLGAGEEAQLRKHYTESSEAYRLYLLGRFHWDKRVTDQVLKAIEHYEKAIETDPNYALAYTGLSDAYTSLGGIGALPARTAHPKARQYAEKALAMDENLAEAHVSLAAALADYYWDWTGAEREFRRAIELNPNNVVAHYWYGSYLAQIGRFDAAEAEVKRALEIDPLSLIARGILSIVYYRARNFEAATDVLNNALQMDSGYMPAHLDLGLIFIQTRDYQRAIDHFLKMEEVSGGTTAAPGLLGMAYGLAGREAEARATLKRLSGPSNSAFMSPLDVAFIYIGLGDRDRAFEWLEKAYEERVWQMGLLKVGPEFDPLRSDPRFADLVRRVGVP